MWKDMVYQLKHDFPEAVRLYRPATDAQLQKTGQLLGVNLEAIDNDWVEFLQVTNGAGFLFHLFYGAMNSQIATISEINLQLWGIDDYRWVKEHFICFFSHASSQCIGFVRENQQTRCIAFISELTDNAVLPIASSFKMFLASFLQDVSRVLTTWRSRPGEQLPYFMPGNWPLNLHQWCERDIQLKQMLKKGELRDLFSTSPEYDKIVKNALKG